MARRLPRGGSAAIEGGRRALEVVGAPELDGERLPALEAPEEGRIGCRDGLCEAQEHAGAGAEEGEEEAGLDREMAQGAMRPGPVQRGLRRSKTAQSSPRREGALVRLDARHAGEDGRREQEPDHDPGQQHQHASPPLHLLN